MAGRKMKPTQARYRRLVRMANRWQRDLEWIKANVPDEISAKHELTMNLATADAWANEVLSWSAWAKPLNDQREES